MPAAPHDHAHDHDEHAHDDHAPGETGVKHAHHDHAHDDHDGPAHDHEAHGRPAAGRKASGGHAHAHGHDHDHGHGHHHHGVPREGVTGWAFALGIGLNVLFTVVEVAYGLASHSVALVADAAHNLSDVLGLGLAWGAVWLSRKAPTGRRTYGFRRSTILAALANGVLLVGAIGAIVWEALGRLREAHPVQGTTVIAVAAVGVVINGLSAALFARGRGDANIRGAFLHLAMDATVSLGVVVTGVVLLKTGWWWLDPAVSLVVSAVVLAGTWSLLREALGLAMDSVPAHVDIDDVRSYLASLPGVEEVHDLHIWALSTTETALTAHLCLPWPSTPPTFLKEVTCQLEERFRIDHVTLQIEPTSYALECKQAPDHAL